MQKDQELQLQFVSGNQNGRPKGYSLNLKTYTKVLLLHSQDDIKASLHLN